MQEIHPIGGGRFFGGGSGGDRRLRPHHHHHNSNIINNNNNNNQNHHQALKCPRCDSLNTKFCYYNNYNLSQPRYFCKSCRRYWTKGGVLRNVPVGGGCRKSKRSKPKNSSSETPAAVAAAAPAETTSLQQPEQDQLKTTSNSHSSSESSAASAPSSNLDNHNLPHHESNSFFVHPNSNPSFEPGPGDSGIFSEIGNLTSLIASSSNEAMAFGYGGSIPDATSFQFTHPHPQDLKFAEISTSSMSGSLIDQTVPVDLSAMQSKIGHGGFGPLDWQSSTDQGLFDLTNTVDQAYWAHTQWNQDNPTLFPLP